MKHRALGAVALVSAFLAQPASAITILTSYEGTIASGTDVSGVFGTANADLAGLEFALVYVYDLATPGALVSSSPTVSTAEGFGSSVLGSIRLTIGTETKLISNPDYTFQDIIDTQLHQVSNTFSKTIAQGPFPVLSYFAEAAVGGFVTDFIPSATFGTPISYVVQPGGFANGRFGFDNDPLFSHVGVSELAFGTLDIESVTVTAVPEAEAWIMMICGFAFVGGAMRARRASRLGTVALG
jgi:hypothetical protein